MNGEVKDQGEKIANGEELEIEGRGEKGEKKDQGEKTENGEE